MADGNGSARLSPRTSFIGREAEMAALLDDLDGTAVVTIIGPGGVGKTRLALELAARGGELFPDGVATVALASVGDAGLVAAEVASSVGLPRTGGRPYVEALGDWLEGRRLLLVLDNCEHLLAPVAPLVEELARRLPDLRLLATSREPLEVAGEAVHRLAPLSAPGRGASETEILASESVRLFADRAAARRRGAAPGGAEEKLAIAEICRRLDGLPLAIELAAARVGGLAPAEIARRLDDRFGLLSGGLRTAEERHRTLRSAVEWSDALLDDDERRLLRRLSVLAGFDLAAARAVGDPDGDDVVVADLVGRLVDKSLLARADEDPSRYSMLETIREFAAERLDAAGEADAARAAHTEWFAAEGARIGGALMAGNERAGLERLSADHDNLRAALARLLDGPEPERGLALATSLSMFWWTRGHHREGVDWLRRALERAAGAPAELRVAGLFHLAFLWAHDTDDWAAAAELLDEALALAEADPEVSGSPIHGYALCFRGQAANNAGEHRRALELTTRGATIIRSFPDPWGAGFALWNVGHTYVGLGETAAAAACFEEMEVIQREHGIGLVLMIACQSRAELAEGAGEIGRARALQEEALALRRALGAARLGYVHGSLPGSLVAVARLALAEGDVAAARTAAAEALPLAEERRDEEVLAEARALLAAADGDGGRSGVLARRGSAWEVAFDGESALLPDAKGLRQLRELLTRPGQDVSAIALAAVAGGGNVDVGDAGPLLDEEARRAYRRRLEEIEGEIEEAARFNDPERRAASEAEREALVAELARATGLGGRERRAASGSERARVNVTRTLREAIRRIAAECPALGGHLERSVRTGNHCRYEPETPVAWRL